MFIKFYNIFFQNIFKIDKTTILKTNQPNNFVLFNERRHFWGIRILGKNKHLKKYQF